MATDAKKNVLCPTCGSTSVSRSHRRNFLERIFRAVITPHRCQLCGRRFFQTHLPETRAKLALQPLRLPVIIAIVVAVLALWPIHAQILRLMTPVISVFGGGSGALNRGG